VTSTPFKRTIQKYKIFFTFYNLFPDIRNMVKNCARAGFDTSINPLVGVIYLSS
jgi:hypothetical protein